MRLCANESIPEDCVIRLRQTGHDVLWIRETAPGSPDNDVLARAVAEDRLFITFDKDFGELVFRRGAKASQGVVLFRMSQPSAAVVAERVAAFESALRELGEDLQMRVWLNSISSHNYKDIASLGLPRLSGV